MFIVIYLSRFCAAFDASHWKAAKRVLRYLTTTIDKKLTYHQQPEGSPLNLITYSDSDWAGDQGDRRSFSGCIVYFLNCPVCWISKKQITVALSSVEAEYMALSDATKETLYVLNLLKQFFDMLTPASINIDNRGAGYIAENNINNKLTKHIDIRYHFVRHYINEKTVELFYVPSSENIADILTKALGPETFNKLAAKIVQ
jgi:hypothetical protein